MERVNTVRELVDSLIEKITVDPQKDHNTIKKNEFTHSYGVAMLCKALALKRGLDPELAGIIGHLHDLGRILYNSLDDTHGAIGALEAQKLLKENGSFTQQEIELICTAISNHMYKGIVGSPYDELIKDADIMERYFWRPELYMKHGGERLKRVLEELGLVRE